MCVCVRCCDGEEGATVRMQVDGVLTLRSGRALFIASVQEPSDKHVPIGAGP